MAVNEEREEQIRGRKSLGLAVHPGMMQEASSAVRTQTNEGESERTVADAVTQGFAGGFIAGAQNRMFASAGAGKQDDANPSWRKNNREVVALNTKFMAATAESIALMDRDIENMTDPADVGHRLQLIGARAKAVDGMKNMQLSMAHDQVNEDVQAGAYTDSDVEALRQGLGHLQAANDQMRFNQRQHGGGDLAKTVGHKSPVRNANGKSLADLTAPAPGEEPLPGTAQPLVMDAIDAVQGKVPARPSKSAAGRVVMNPAHVAALQSLDHGHQESLERTGGDFSR